MTTLRNLNCIKFSKYCIQVTNYNSLSSGLKASSVGDSVSTKEDTFYHQREKYISEVIANFVKLGENKGKNNRNKLKCENSIGKQALQAKTSNRSTNKIKVKKCLETVAAALLIDNKDSCSYNSKKNMFNKVELINEGTEIKDKIDTSEVDKEIKYSLDQKNYDEAFNVFNSYWNKKAVPSYKILRALTSVVSVYGNSSKVSLMQEVAEYYYPKEFGQDLCFSHYLCEAKFREGEYSLALSMLRNTMERYPKTKRLKEIASYIMRKMTKAPEELADETFKIACDFITFSNQPKPAYSLWYCMVQSNYHKHQCVANDLLDFYPQLLDDKDDKSRELIEKAFLDDNVEFLHRLNESFLKTDKKHLITAVSSALLSLYCLSENLNSANEVIKFAHDEKFNLSKDSLRMYIHFLHKLKLPTPLAVLAFKYGFGIPASSKIKTRMKPSKYTFRFD